MDQTKPFLDIINEHITSGETKLPAFSKTGLHVQQEAAKNDADIRKIEKLITYDQALTSQVLKMANSAFFAGFESIRTVHEAVVRLGIDEIANVVTLATHEANFHSKDPFIQRLLSDLWKHSVVCAFGCQWVTKRCGFHDILHEVFFAGLLHDVGKLFLLTVIEEIRESEKLNMKLSDSLIDEIMKTLHTEQGYLLMKNWNLPEIYGEVARDHHKEEFDGTNTLMAIVRVVNSTCHKTGAGTTKDESIAPAVTGEANFLGLSEVGLAELEVQLDDYMTKLGHD